MSAISTIAETVSNASKLVRQAIGSALSSVHAGDKKITSHQPENAGVQQLVIRSSTFNDGSPIPIDNTPQGANRSPELSWTGVPGDTQELVLIVEDPDAPMLQPFTHWMMHRIPPKTILLPTGLPEQKELPQLGGAIQGKNDAKVYGWFGPQPPLGHGVHHYHFQLFAIDTTLNLGVDATLEQVKEAMSGHVLADGEIVGTYERTASAD